MNIEQMKQTLSALDQRARLKPVEAPLLTLASQTIIAQAEEIERLKSKFPQWVSVNERLPDVFTGYSQDVLVLRGDTVSPKIQIGYLRAAKELQWFGYYDEEYRFNDVTHWMPLPKQPEGEGDE